MWRALIDDLVGKEEKKNKKEEKPTNLWGLWRMYGYFLLNNNEAGSVSAQDLNIKVVAELHTSALEWLRNFYKHLSGVGH